jgi:hypothetical protein
VKDESGESGVGSNRKRIKRMALAGPEVWCYCAGTVAGALHCSVCDGTFLVTVACTVGIRICAVFGLDFPGSLCGPEFSWGVLGVAV